MTALRRAFSVLLLAAGFGPIGCAWRGYLTDPAPDPGDGIRVPKESQFASLVRAPGDAVSLTGDGSIVVVATGPTPPATGPVAPPAKSSEPVPVDPPQPAGPDPFLGDPRQLPTTEPFLVAARAAWDGRPDRVADALRPLDKASQDAVRPLLTAAAAFARSEEARSPQALVSTVAQMRAALAAAERRIELRIENARFIRELYGYRWYDPMPESPVFRPGGSINVYFEVTPLAVDPLPGGGWGTHVAYTLKVIDAKGQAVHLVDQKGHWSSVLLFDEKMDRTKGPVREKHLMISFAGPQVPGPYVAEFEARDVHTGRVAKQVLEFRVGGR